LAAFSGVSIDSVLSAERKDPADTKDLDF